jgi:hypothetical protein
MSISNLIQLYEGDFERVGFILKTGEIVEVANICENPSEGFDVSGADLLKFAPIAQATWHTHPGADSNLSTSDWHSFLNWPELDHYIIGNDGVTKFVVEDGEVLIAS